MAAGRAREAAELAVGAALDAHVDEGVLTKDGLGVEIGGEEARVALECRLGRQAAHVGRANHVLQEFLHVGDVGVHRNLAR
eukprot:2816814-Pleurochrysis_carterae.AAC.1